jgi:hypothetical protein
MREGRAAAFVAAVEPLLRLMERPRDGVAAGEEQGTR